MVYIFDFTLRIQSNAEVPLWAWRPATCRLSSPGSLDGAGLFAFIVLFKLYYQTGKMTLVVPGKASTGSQGVNISHLGQYNM